MKQLKDYNLRSNPFRSVPANVKSPELTWAGFPQIKEKFEGIIRNSIKYYPSQLVLNWGEYGSGKTHAARYFNKAEVLQKISDNSPVPLFIPIDFPQSKQPVWDIIKSIIDNIDFKKLRASVKGKINIEKIVEDTTDNIFVQSTVKAIFNDKIDIQIMKIFLYKTISRTDLNKKLLPYGIERPISSDNDHIDIISTLFSVMTYDKTIFSCVILWFDEFEDITAMSNSNIININSFLRQLFEKTGDNLLMLLNITQTSMIDQDDLSEYLNQALVSRISNSVEIALPSVDEIKLYLIELLNNEVFRINEVANKFYPVEEEVIDIILSKLNNPSIRKINEIFSLLLTVALDKGADAISKKFYEENEYKIL